MALSCKWIPDFDCVILRPRSSRGYRHQVRMPKTAQYSWSSTSLGVVLLQLQRSQSHHLHQTQLNHPCTRMLFSFGRIVLIQASQVPLMTQNLTSTGTWPRYSIRTRDDEGDNGNADSLMRVADNSITSKNYSTNRSLSWIIANKFASDALACIFVLQIHSHQPTRLSHNEWNKLHSANHPLCSASRAIAGGGDQKKSHNG
jgi:hypothetical protein